MRSSVERRKLQRCVACHVKSSINLLRRLLKESCWTSQLACNVCSRKIENTLLTLQLNPAEHTKERWQRRKQPAQQALGSSGRKRERARARETRVSPSRAPVFSCAHQLQAPATQAKGKEFRLNLEDLQESCNQLFK